MFDVIMTFPFSDGCVTIGGAKVGAQCVFPFEFDGKTYNGCTFDDSGKLCVTF